MDVWQGPKTSKRSPQNEELRGHKRSLWRNLVRASREPKIIQERAQGISFKRHQKRME